ncbi:ImmA/IrrE family metallo-endopeptidase [Sulfitobacter sp. 1A12056]|uniref:ImmA/IrrE family metallo-endopeptidase n=1 Tax=Sulfitobacter sp. 1A12056 TaxID=3368592 RepID=UPI0037465F88
MRQELFDRDRPYHPSELLKDAGIEKPPVNLDKLVDFLGVTVREDFDFDMMGLSGTILWSKDRSTADIWINPLDSEQRRRFTLSHELGHLFKHMLPSYTDREKAEEFRDGPVQFYRDGKISAEEREANQFAAQLLMPSEMVRQYAKVLADKHRKPSGKVGLSKDAFVSEMAKDFNVSKQAMEFRLMNLRII